ncbi:MAG: response regulator [Bacteroidales bacterium]|nr:response regulator [Bacteroidales bacterium]
MKPISIYIVEDELLISASLKSQLNNFGYEVCGSASRGETCLSEILELSERGREPEIVLMDIHLRGDLDGIETAKRINEQFNCAIIFLTGQSSKEVYDRSFKIKPFGYLLKPIDMEQTKMTIEIASYQRNLEIENKQYQKTLEALLEKRSEENREMMALNHTISDNVLIGITIWQNGQLVFFNNRAPEIFGYSAEGFSALSLMDLMNTVHPSDRGELSSRIHSCLDRINLDPQRIQIRTLATTEKIKYLDISFRMIDYKGFPALTAGFIDISDYRNQND